MQKDLGNFDGLQVQKSEGTCVVQQSRRPNLSSLQIPERTLETSLHDFTRLEIISIQSPSSAKAGLPPRPSSAKLKSSVRNLLPQRSLRVKNVCQDGEDTVLILPDAPPSDGYTEKPSTSRSFSLNKVLFPASLKATHSLPATPIANSGSESISEKDTKDVTEHSVSYLQLNHHIMLLVLYFSFNFFAIGF